MVVFIWLGFYPLFKGQQLAYLARWRGIEKCIAKVVLVKTFQTVNFTILLRRRRLLFYDALISSCWFYKIIEGRSYIQLLLRFISVQTWHWQIYILEIVWCYRVLHIMNSLVKYYTLLQHLICWLQRIPLTFVFKIFTSTTCEQMIGCCDSFQS